PAVFGQCGQTIGEDDRSVPKTPSDSDISSTCASGVSPQAWEGLDFSTQTHAVTEPLVVDEINDNGTWHPAPPSLITACTRAAHNAATLVAAGVRQWILAAKRSSSQLHLASRIEKTWARASRGFGVGSKRVVAPRHVPDLVAPMSRPKAPIVPMPK